MQFRLVRRKLVKVECVHYRVFPSSWISNNSSAADKVNEWCVGYINYVI